ncbi:exported hypothetical protein [Planktothrix serta PCC 8927]|uniref:Sulfatase-modifying factor enzyme-like domain-containing protein n=1 Tax=Planktothrix serta PCC 8927 TaxID=671068 RepID=A0A7Z9DZL5_9CYAN|nr:formylglycine-generating enzyme family protein [Planktothrix serta]VXD17845.1 exported hypothetical protein [Planktothrix serta PCC 8927]
MSKKTLNRRKALLTILSFCFIVPGVATFLNKKLAKSSRQSTLKSNSNNSINLNPLSSPESITLQILDEKSLLSEETIEIYPQELNTDTRLEMVKIKAGSCKIGSNPQDSDHLTNEAQGFKITMQEFYMSRYPITQEQWQAVMGMGNNPSTFLGETDLPVETVSWYEAKEFCDKLTNSTKQTYRLPSETEWEYACRAYSETPFYFGDKITPTRANYDTYYSSVKSSGDYHGKTIKVGQFPANKFGLKDMHGNVWEWCQDSWHKDHQNTPKNGEAYENKDEEKAVIRGGAWHSFPLKCRSAAREGMWKNMRSNRIGFRVVMEIKNVTSLSKNFLNLR